MSGNLSPQVMFSYDTHHNVPWNMVEYEPLKEYHGKEIMANRKNRYQTKRGSYMDRHIKEVKDLPSPDKYAEKRGFDQSKNLQYSKRVKIDSQVKKNSYIDQIEREGKKTKIGVGSYNLEKTKKQIEAKLTVMKKSKKMDKSTRISFCENTQSHTVGIPGAGAYNPHLEVQHSRKEMMTPEKWKTRHKSEYKAEAKRNKKIPGPGSYRPASAGTFYQTYLDSEIIRKKKSKSMSRGFGTDTKFEYMRPRKKKIVEARPDPTRYDLSIKWKGKKDQTSRSGWNSFIASRSHSTSVYH